ncbi:MAG TPA: NUDIX hydrolase [Anaerolineae bacterium]|nr:NUDIX hydrolase [Anaerolineae bacterium]
MDDCLAVPGLVEAERLYGRPEVRYYDLGDCGDERRFWDMWQKRQGEVVLVIHRSGGRVVLQTKQFYPPGTYRLPSGGIEPGEALLDAVRREMREETGLEARIERFLGALCYRFRRAGRAEERASYVFLLGGGAQPLASHDAAERISGFREVPSEELSAVAAQLESLPGEWAVWGRFRALVHRFVRRNV